jgi:hypothetical protein
MLLSKPKKEKAPKAKAMKIPAEVRGAKAMKIPTDSPEYTHIKNVKNRNKWM